MVDFGTLNNGNNLTVSAKDRTTHMHVIGGSGRGKSVFLANLIRQDILDGRNGLCVIDPHGELYDSLVLWLSSKAFLPKRRKIHLLNLSDQKHSFGFNPLKVDNKSQLTHTVDEVASSLAHVWGNGDLSQTPLIKDSIERILFALADNELTLAESSLLVDYQEIELRRKLTQHLSNPEYVRAWADIETKTEKQFAEEFGSIQRRLRALTSSPVVRNVIGQTKNTLNFKQIMDNGEVVLINLAVNEHLSAENARIIGTLLVNDMYLNALKREPNIAKTFYLYIDEAQRFLTDNIDRMFTDCRKFGLSLTIAHQYLQQLKENSELIYHSVLTNPGLKVSFGNLNHHDAREMANTIFAGYYDPHKINPATMKPVVTGHDIIKLHGGSDTVSSGETRAESTSESHTSGENYNESSVQSRSQGTGSGMGEQLLIRDEGDILNSQNISDSQFSATGSSSAWSSGQFSGSGGSSVESIAESTATGHTESHNEALKPIIEERGNPYSLQEQEKLFADALITQQIGQATVRVPSGEVFNFSPPEPQKPFTTERKKLALERELLLASPTISPINSMEDEIRHRENGLRREGQNQAIDFFDN